MRSGRHAYSQGWNIRAGDGADEIQVSAALNSHFFCCSINTNDIGEGRFEHGTSDSNIVLLVFWYEQIL